MIKRIIKIFIDLLLFVNIILYFFYKYKCINDNIYSIQNKYTEMLILKNEK